MDWLQTGLEMLWGWVRAIWPGALGAAVGGYIGWSVMGFPGFLIATALGALGGTWAGSRLGLVPVRRLTGSATNDQLLYAAGAFLLIVLGFFLVQFVIVLAAIVAVAMLVMFWMQL